MPAAGVILQARMGSRRLPGKVLQRIGGRTLIDHAVTRLRSSGFPVIVATTDLDDDLPVEAEGSRLGVRVFRGHPTDVLRRYCDAAADAGVDVVIRATADNPFVDGDAPKRVVRLIEATCLDYVVEFGLPVGAAVEAVRRTALEHAHVEASDPYDREHVTPFIRRESVFRQLRAAAPPDLRRPGLSLTVDTPEDLEYVRALFDACRPASGLPALTDVIRAAERVRRKAPAAVPVRRMVPPRRWRSRMAGGKPA